MKRVLVIAPQWIGDAVMSQPLLATLAAAGHRVSVAALPWVAPVYRAMPQVAEVHALPFAHGRLDLMARYRLGASWRGHHDIAVILPNSLKAALLPLFAGIPTRIGYVGEARQLLLTASLPNPDGRPPMVAFYRALAALTGDLSSPVASGAAPARPVLLVAPERVATVLARHGLTPGGYWVFAPGAEYGPAKCWPAAHYAQLVGRLANRPQAVEQAGGPAGTKVPAEMRAERGARPQASVPPVVLLGSAKEAPLTGTIAQEATAAGVHVVDLAGQTSLDDALVLLSACRGLVSNDSGLMHVGAAFGVPQVAVFGSTSPEHTPPLNPRARVVWLKDELQLDCAPCFERTCRFGHLRCLNEITPQRVADALDSALTLTSGSGSHLSAAGVPA